MFRDAYRKANDSIHAPEALKETIRAAWKESEPDIAASFEPTKKRVWPRVLGYSGAAIATAALVLLVVRPFGRDRPRSLWKDPAHIPSSESGQGG